MKRRKIVQILSAVFCVVALLFSSTVPAFANSAQTRYEGVNSTGAIMTDDESPIIVEKELLTFDIQEFPKEYYRTTEEFLAYGAKVTAEYTFYNPSEYTVTATLLFPFGNLPTYNDVVYYDETGNPRPLNDTDKYDLTINGENIDKRIRHSLHYYYEQFDLETDIALLHDDFVSDEFYSPELTVMKYTYEISGVDTEKYSAADVAFDVSKGNGKTVIYFPQMNGCHAQDDEQMRIQTWVDENQRVIELYAIGEPFTELPEWRVYENGAVEDGKEIAGTITLVNTETCTFKDFAMDGWSAESGVSETDWYNAVVAELLADETHYEYPIVDLERYEDGLYRYLMRWYEYEITLKPGERIVNTVTAPVYPSINMNYEPPIFSYTYLLSPAKTWKDFGKLDIVVNTPYYITESNMEGFTKTENGYSLTLDGLPDGELEFVLCSAEQTTKSSNGYFSTEWIYIAVVLGIVLVAGGVICFRVIRKKHPKSKQ